MKIGLDIHGVIDKFPDLFKELAEGWTREGHEVHIITGEKWETAAAQIAELDIWHGHHFSIVDYHQLHETDISYTKTGPWMDGHTWNSTKGLYARREGLDIHFDDTLRYAQHFPRSCSFVWVGKNFEAVCREILADKLDCCGCRYKGQGSAVHPCQWCRRKMPDNYEANN